MPRKPSKKNDVIALAKERWQKLNAQLASRPIEKLIGVVAPGSEGGWPNDDEKWTWSMQFSHWRIPPGPMKGKPLSITSTTSRRKFESLSKRVISFQIVRIRARVAEDSVMGTPHAELIEFLGPDVSDSEMNQIAIDLQKPVIHEDRRFGRFTKDRRLNSYDAQTEWNGTEVRLHLNLELDRKGTIDGALQTARTLWRAQKGWKKRIEHFAVSELLPIWNDCWRDDEEPERTGNEFKAFLELETITVRANGSFEFWYFDGNLFLGHRILVSGNLTKGPIQAALAG